MSNPQFDSIIQDSGTQFTSSIRELVRGREQEFLAELQPLVRGQSVRLDLNAIERIDAAGLAALVSLYCDACSTGHEFALVNPSHRVARILALVGLDRILVLNSSRNAADSLSAQPGCCMNHA
jgi:anti-anti-sigma factor